MKTKQKSINQVVHPKTIFIEQYFELKNIERKMINRKKKTKIYEIIKEIFM